MRRNLIIRTALALTVPFNLLAAFLFALPGSLLGRFAGLPADVPPLYCALVALFLMLFAGAYAWLLFQATISRPLLAFTAIGKSLAFFTFIFLWLLRLGPANAALASV